MTDAAAARKIAEDLIALAAKATPGEWEAYRQDEDSGAIYFALHSHQEYEFITNFNDGRARANSHYVAAANPEAITALAQAYISLSRPQAGTLTPEEVLAVDNLRTCQEQLDRDGCMVAVSRQAVEETLAALDRLTTPPATEEDA